MAAPIKESLLLNENDLKSTLMSQKLRVEQHRTNYETLKAQHIVLQKVLADLIRFIGSVTTVVTGTRRAAVRV